MIMAGVIQYVEKKEGKIVYLEVKLNRVLAVCFGGNNLIDNNERYYIDYNIKNGLNYSYLESMNFFYQNLLKHGITGYIRSNNVNINLKLDI